MLWPGQNSDFTLPLTGKKAKGGGREGMGARPNLGRHNFPYILKL